MSKRLFSVVAVVAASMVLAACAAPAPPPTPQPMLQLQDIGKLAPQEGESEQEEISPPTITKSGWVVPKFVGDWKSRPAAEQRELDCGNVPAGQTCLNVAFYTRPIRVEGKPPSYQTVVIVWWASPQVAQPATFAYTQRDAAHQLVHLAFDGREVRATQANPPLFGWASEIVITPNDPSLGYEKPQVHCGGAEASIAEVVERTTAPDNVVVLACPLP